MIYVAPYLLVYKKLVVNNSSKVQLFINLPKNYNERIQKYNKYSSNKSINLVNIKTNIFQSKSEVNDKYSNELIDIMQDYNSSSEKIFSNEELKIFSNEFKKNLLQLTCYHHEIFVKNNNIKYDIFTSKAWNSQFNLDSIKEIPNFSLPKLEEELSSKLSSKVNDLLDNNNLSKQLFEYNYNKSLENFKNDTDNLKDDFSILAKNSYLSLLSKEAKISVSN